MSHDNSDQWERFIKASYANLEYNRLVWEEFIEEQRAVAQRIGEYERLLSIVRTKDGNYLG
jgi:hypothetical protein